MRTFISALALGVLTVCGCTGHQGGSSFADVTSTAAGRPPSWPKETVIITPDNGLVGKVVRVNTEGRFVVLNFPIGHLPRLDQHLNVYRLGLKVGEVKVTGPQLDDNVVGDLATGDARAGDEVRAQ